MSGKLFGVVAAVSALWFEFFAAGGLSFKK